MRKLSINQVISTTCRKQDDTCASIEFGSPKTDKSRCAPDFTPFVAALLAEHRSGTAPLRGQRCQDRELVFPSQVGTPNCGAQHPAAVSGDLREHRPATPAPFLPAPHARVVDDLLRRAPEAHFRTARAFVD